MASLNELLLALLECPVCYDHVQPPIFSCANGHLACARCRDQLSGCSLCRGEFAATSSRFVERVVELLEFPCPNAGSGCALRFKASSLAAHALGCAFDCRCYVEECVTDVFVTATQRKRVKVERRRECVWRGAKGALRQHVDEAHGGFYAGGGGGGGGGGRLTSFVKLDQLRVVREARLIEAFGEIFWSFLFIADESGECYGVVKHVNDPAASSEQFSYKVEFHPRDVACPSYTLRHRVLSKVTFRGATVSITSSASDADEGFVLARGSLQRLTTDDRGIVYSVEIKRCLMF